MTRKELASKLASERAIYGAGLRRQRMLETEDRPSDDEFELDDLEDDDVEE